MPFTPPESGYFLKSGDVVNIGVDLPDMTFAVDVATVVSSENGVSTLQLCGEGFSQQPLTTSGSKVLLSKGSGRDLFQCTARIKDVGTNGSLQIESLKQVMVRERREYMRLDVSVPVDYSLPQNQNMAKVISEWERAKDCDRHHFEGIEPLPPGHRTHVNLSGGGLRFNIRDCYPCGTLLHLKIALPGERPTAIHTVGTIVRTKELPAAVTSEKQHSTSISFRMIAMNDRQKLVRHILDEQRKVLMQSSRNSL